MEARTAGRKAALVLPARLRSPLPALAAITLAGGLLRLWALGDARPNPYYDAAVRSMSLSLHNFLFAAYEPGGSVAIDKPPVDLWLQVLSVKLLGFGPRGLVAPQAIASTAAIPLLYGAVRRAFGTGAGLASAAALAVLPISVVTARSDTMDSLAMTLTVAALWMTVRAVQTERARLVVAAGALCGLAFEVKLFEGLIVVPALALLYWLGARAAPLRRVRHLGLAGVALVVVALAWPVAVSLVPGSQRPYPIGSKDGTVWSAIFDFNGAQRLSGPRHPHPPPSHPRRAAVVPAVPKAPFTPPGPGRLLARGGWDLGWLVGVELLAAALLGGLALVGRPWRSRAGPGEPARLRRAAGAAIALWLVVATALFSATQVLHPRYLEALAPPVAAALGVGLAGLARLARRAAPLRVAAAAVLLGACAYSISIGPALGGLVGAAGGAAALLLVLRPRAPGGGRALLAGVAAAVAAVALLAVPARTSVRLVDAHATDAGELGSMPAAQLDALSGYLAPRTRGARYEVAAASYAQVPALIVRDARPVIILGQVAKQPLASATAFETAARRGEVRYALVGGSCGRARSVVRKHCLPAVRWIRAHGVDVTQSAGLPSRGLLFHLRPRHLTRSQHARRPR